MGAQEGGEGGGGIGLTLGAAAATFAAMTPFQPFDLDDLKLVYRTLHTQLLVNMDLLDCGFFSDLQAHLQALAKADGVDVGDHGRWDAWLKRPSTGLKIVS